MYKKQDYDWEELFNLHITSVLSMKIFCKQGYTDLRKRMDGYASIVQDHFQLHPFEGGLLYFVIVIEKN